MKDQHTEITEAVQAADRALNHLRSAKDCLNSAGNWGLADMLGGKLLTTFMKHRKMNDAERELTLARDAMRSFARELRDVNGAVEIEIRVDDFLSFADYFFDGLIVDWMMQSRISAAKKQVADAIDQVQTMRATLQRML
ncbi:MAG: hypothetical protein VB099_20185 [Candidatus Limiplasma sp.]|nr:hypothetical protein [Candidatus Limiplasma sp.]